MIRFLGALTGALSSALIISAVIAQDLKNVAPGTKLNGVVSLGTKQIPLPVGEWEIVFAKRDKLWNYAGVPMESGNLFLVQKADGKHRAYIFARTNFQNGGNGWYRRRFCDRNNVHHNGSDSFYDKDNADCWILGHFVVASRRAGAPFFRNAKEYIRKNVGTSTVIMNWYWRNDPSDYLMVSHYANPAAYGFPALAERRWMDSEWHPAAVGEAPRHQKFIEAAKAFGAKYRDALGAGFRNRFGTGDSGLEFVVSR